MNRQTIRKIFLIGTVLLCMINAFGQREKINKALARELANLYQDDQRFRVLAIQAAKKYGAYSKEDRQLMEKQRNLDTVNLKKIEKIIGIHGYPGKSLVGAQAKVAFMIVQHNDLEAQEKYLPLFLEAADKGELDKALLPLMIDRIRTAKGQLQIYGTQLSEDRDGKIKIFPIEEETQVNVRRKQMGLAPLEMYYRNWGIEYKVPTPAGNTNPKDLYVNAEQQDPLAVTAIGGDQGIKNRLKYPEQARKNQVSGFVTIEFTVDKDGLTKNVSVVKGLGYGCDEEAIRVIKETKYLNQTGEDRELRMKLPFPNTNK